MKINRRDPKQLTVLALSALTTVFAVGVYWGAKLWPRRYKTIIFYGHTLNGNLKAFYDYLADKKGYRAYFLVLDKNYLNQLKTRGESTDGLLYALNLRDMFRVGLADAFVTSHGLHFFSPLKKLTNIKFFDVWHGIPYKGFDADDLGHLHDHTQAWVSSPAIRDMYIEKFGFRPDRVKSTGYARVDQLVNKSLDKQDIIDKYGLRPAKKYVLIAPTWAQDEKGRSILPFGVSEKKFFGDLDKIAHKQDALVIFRTHLNSSDNVDVGNLKNTVFMPYAKYELAEEFLYITDVLVTDWSSIAFDFLPLDRPTIFLDVKAPFKKGFSLGPEYRFGEVAKDFDQLKCAVDLYLKNPAMYKSKYKDVIKKTKEVAYGKTLDGKSSGRYEREMNAVLEQR